VESEDEGKGEEADEGEDTAQVAMVTTHIIVIFLLSSDTNVCYVVAGCFASSLLSLVLQSSQSYSDSVTNCLYFRPA
jgi:hypothetical protein